MSKSQFQNNKYLEISNNFCHCGATFYCSGSARYNLVGVAVAPATFRACSGSGRYISK